MLDSARIPTELFLFVIGNFGHFRFVGCMHIVRVFIYSVLFRHSKRRLQLLELNLEDQV